MQTIGKHAGKAHEGDFVATCAYCGVAWYRSRLVRNPAGQLICPDHQHIRDPVTLSRLNARRSSRLTSKRVDGGVADTEAKTTAGPLSVLGEASVVAGWEASSGVAFGAGGRVSSWTALSGGVSLVQTNANRQPKLKTDGPSGRSYVSFENVAALEEETGALDRPPLTEEPTFYWAVVRQPRMPYISIWWAFETSIAMTLAAISLDASLSQVAEFNANATALVGQFQRIEMSFTGGTADYVKIGPRRTAGGSAGAADPVDVFALGAFELPGVNELVWPAWLDICEFWILRVVPSATQLDKLDDYARAKYGSAVLL